MELRSLGTFRLVQPLPTSSTSYRMVLARHQDDPEDQPPAYLVKILLPSPGEEHALLRASFDHEIELLKAFNHPSIPSAHAEGEQDGARYVIMDYIDGVDLASLLGHDRGEPRGLSKEMAVYIMGQLADALHYVHTFEAFDEAKGDLVSLDVLHRDIAPSNILLSRSGNVLLADFNTARSRLLAPEHDTVHAGTKAYMAPERIVAASPASQQSDLFSMAVVLWEILKGERCFKAEDDLRTIDAIVRFDISHPTKRVSGLSAKLGEIVRKNLDRDPGRRYSGAYQMLQRLAQAPEAAAAERSRAELGDLVAEAADALPLGRR
ncbi:MAG: serine/threonine protein kinase [Myxococcales bacterium]|nr:serine/threonine protein kinase [Myxococcales bacterium]